jgi:uncharacterized protein (TIGR03435 family)
MKPRLLVLYALALGALQGQPLQFEVASVRPTPPGDQNVVNIGLHMDGSQASINAFTMRQDIAVAYEVRPNRVVGGPDWITSERFDIRATLPAGSSTKQIPEMLRGLLAERFALKLHRGQKELQVYALSLGSKPLTLKQSADQDTGTGDVNIAATGSSEGVAVNLGGGASYTFTNNKFVGRKLTMARLVNSLDLYMNLPVVDNTKLTGFYDLSLEITNEDYRAMLARAAMANGIVLPPQAQQFADSATTPSLFEAIEKLGLKLEVRRLPMDVLIVDDINRTPTEN